MSDRMHAEADRWYYDLGRLAEQVENNYARSEAARNAAEAAQKKALIAQHRAENARKRLTAVACFALFAFLLVAWRTEVANNGVMKTQRDACGSNLEISRKFNRGQDALIAIERRNFTVPQQIRNDRIKVYQEVRILPLPICAVRWHG